MYLHAALCEDDRQLLRIIASKVKQTFGSESVYMEIDCCSDARTMLEKIQAVQYHIFPSILICRVWTELL